MARSKEDFKKFIEDPSAEDIKREMTGEAVGRECCRILMGFAKKYPVRWNRVREAYNQVVPGLALPERQKLISVYVNLLQFSLDMKTKNLLAKTCSPRFRLEWAIKTALWLTEEDV